jgi:predicted nucleic acid-binding Zn ribbon protein
MPRCPHCGETMAKGQETCFACGQHIRERAHRRKQPVNTRVIVFLSALILVAVVGVIVMSSGRASRSRAEARRQEQARSRDSARAAVRARRDSARAAARSDATAMLVSEIDKLEQRFDLVREQVVKDQPSPAQAKLISQIRSEVAALRQLTMAINDQPGPRADSLKSLLRDGQRTVRTLISSLSRAPKK